MDKTVIKNYATWARQQLMADVTTKLNRIGINSKGIQAPNPGSLRDLQTFGEGLLQYTISGTNVDRRNALVGEINRRLKGSDLQTVIDGLIEEVAYTWFNRLIAIRFMEVNGYLPSGVRVLSSVQGGAEPDIVSSIGRHDATLIESLKLTEDDIKQIDEYFDDNKTDDLYALLFLKQVNALHDNLPELFEETDDYAFLLFTPNYTNSTDGVIARLIKDVPESDFDVDKSGQVEIIGWLYQYYNEEAKAESMKKSKYTEADIAPVTQLFTPDWIVKYMVENSLGRYWVDHLKAKNDTRSESEIAKEFGWQYYMPAATQPVEINNKLIVADAFKADQSIEDIKLLDPAMGSGHILVYAFDVFMQIYESEGYRPRDAAKLIVEKNLFGLDIDTRAYQLAYFAVMMKIRKVWRRALESGVELNLVDVPTSSEIDVDSLLPLVEAANVQDKKQIEDDLRDLINRFRHGNEYGSLIYFDRELNWNDLDKIANVPVIGEQADLFTDVPAYKIKLKELIKAARILASSFENVVTNPPYMGSSKMSGDLKKYVEQNFNDSKTDLSAVFIERNWLYTAPVGYSAMINQQSWMFLSSYDKLRQKVLNRPIVNMAHQGPRAFEEISGEVVQTTAFVQKNIQLTDYYGFYVRLTDFDSQYTKDMAYINLIRNSMSEYVYRTNQSNYNKIPGTPIAYWVTQNLLADFEAGKPLGQIVPPKQGMTTGDNERFLRLWHEINATQFDKNTHNKPWVPLNKGGAYRKWAGNYDYVIRYTPSDIEVMKNYKGFRYDGIEHYFEESVTWSRISSGNFSLRYRQPGSIHASVGQSAFSNDHTLLMQVLAVTNSKVGQYIFQVLNPTLTLSVGDFSNFPYLFNPKIEDTVQKLAVQNIIISLTDWNSFETSWDFKVHPLIHHIDEHNRNWTVEEAFSQWSDESLERFDKLKTNEEELNRIFIDLYGLQDELTPEVADEDIEKSTRKASYERDIKSLISYAVGVMFGRYSLDYPGLTFAGGAWDSSKYKSFQPDADNVLVITEEPLLQNGELDIVNRFVEFIRIAFGEDNLEQNLDYIANALGTLGKKDSRTLIRNYFVTSFFKDHKKMYHKLPIYWQVDAGIGKRSSSQKNSFKALFYLHRYQTDTLATVRINALQVVQQRMEVRIQDLDRMLLNDNSAADEKAWKSERDTIVQQLDAIKEFDTTLAHMASLNTELNLDDGVKVNYQKLQLDENDIVQNILTDINKN